MTAIIGLIFWLVDALLGLLVLALILNAVLSWLVAFDVINLRNRFVYSFANFLDAVTRPVLAPIRKVVPLLGGVDISPIILILLITGIRNFLLDPLRYQLMMALG
ncbi:MAG: YggT family protein [Caulobacter sp.]|nr:YggT family protein [Caulobacter sp.]